MEYLMNRNRICPLRFSNDIGAIDSRMTQRRWNMMFHLIGVTSKVRRSPFWITRIINVLLRFISVDTRRTSMRASVFLQWTNTACSRKKFLNTQHNTSAPSWVNHSNWTADGLSKWKPRRVRPWWIFLLLCQMKNKKIIASLFFTPGEFSGQTFEKSVKSVAKDTPTAQCINVKWNSTGQIS